MGRATMLPGTWQVNATWTFGAWWPILGLSSSGTAKVCSAIPQLFRFPGFGGTAALSVATKDASKKLLLERQNERFN